MKKIIILLSFVMAVAATIYFLPDNRYVSLLKTQISNLKNSGASFLRGEKDRRGQVEYVEGQVEKRGSEEDGWKQAQQGDVLKKGTEMRTLSGSKAVVTFEDGSVARLNENSQIKLDSGDEFLKLYLSGGAVYSRVAKDDSRKYVVSVGDFEVVALGTAFGVEKDEEDLLKVQVVESKVEINKGEQKQFGLVEEGNKAEFSEKSTEIKTAQLTDQDMQDDFMVWNATNDEEYFNKKKVEEKKEVAEKNKETEKKEEVVKNEEVKKVETKKETVKESSDGYATSITLKGNEDGDKVRFSWTISGGSAPKGFKIVKSKDPNPVYPGDDYLYLSDPDDRSAVWKGFKKDKTYYFRICVYKGGECGAYSENVKINFD